MCLLWKLFLSESGLWRWPWIRTGWNRRIRWKKLQDFGSTWKRYEDLYLFMGLLWISFCQLWRCQCWADALQLWKAVGATGQCRSGCRCRCSRFGYGACCWLCQWIRDSVFTSVCEVYTDLAPFVYADHSAKAWFDCTYETDSRAWLNQG